MGAPAAMAGIGAVGNLLSARRANRPQTSTINQTQTSSVSPFGGEENLYNLLNGLNYGAGYALANSPYGPTDDMSRIADFIYGRALNPSFGGDGGGGGGGGGGGAGGGGGRGGGLLGPAGVKLSPEQIANFLPQMNPYMRSILEGEFLDESNPYLADVIESIREDANRQYAESTLPGIDARFARAGRFGPTSDAYSSAIGDAREVLDRGLFSEISRLRAGAYESERDRMMNALGLYSGETNQARGLLGGMRNTDVQRAAAIQQARIQASAQIQQARIAAATQGRALDLQEEQMIFDNALRAYGVSQGQYGAQQEGAMTPFNIFGRLAGQQVPIFDAFGTRTNRTTGTQTGSGAGINPWGAAAQGALGGYTMGSSLGAKGGGPGSGIGMIGGMGPTTNSYIDPGFGAAAPYSGRVK